MPAFHKLRQDVQRCMIADRHRLRSQLNSLQRDLKDGTTQENEKYQKRLDKFRAEIEKSKERAYLRRKNLPKKIKYDTELPIVQRKDEIAKLIRENQVVVVCGETGSGKSTQLPKICLELGLGIHGTIGHTQPRRIAARSVAARVAEELRSPLGQAVGYKVRFTDETGPNTLVKLLTDGMLLAESQNDKFFNEYDTIIIDEAHERSLNIDFLLGMMKRLLSKRRDLKLIITSATIDAKRFAEHFGIAQDQTLRPAPIIEVSGRTYPIEIRYRPLDEQNEEEDIDEEQNLLNAVDELARIDHGDILIFMPTERDIFETAKALRHHKIPGDDSVRKTEILPLYARLTVKEQLKIFKSHSWRRIVIATNVAESSLTVPGIKYVIDPGTARISRYSARSRTQRLPIEAVSRASADQRAGRCGRIGPGICVRLFSEEDYLGRDRYTTPEIQRTNLASVILQTKTLKLGAIETFPFIDPPRAASIRDGYKTLFELGALDAENELTEIGWKLSRLPVDPRIARMILAANDENCLREILIIASILEIQDPRERPLEKQDKADMAHVQFLDPDSDFLAFLKMWDFYHEIKGKLSQNQLRKVCIQNFLSFNRMREWVDIHIQLQQIVQDAKLPLRKRTDDFDAIHRSILTGFLSGIANRTEKYEFTVAGGVGQGKFVLWPGSGLMKRKTKVALEEENSEKNKEKKQPAPKWIVAAERLETTRKYLRTVSKIEPDWIEPLASHLIEKTYQEPHWNFEAGYVHAYEKITLFGLIIIPKRRVNYGPIEPKKSRDIFIQNALVDEELDTKCEFFEYNRLVREEAESLQDKLRKYNLLRGSWARYDFYQARIPEHVYDRRTLEKWYKSAPKKEKESLFFTLGDLCLEEVDATVLDQYPNTLTTCDGAEVPIEYQYKPGETDDGLTVVVPLEGLRQLDPNRLGWLVPGMLEQKIIALLRVLPKEIRRSLVPIPDTARFLCKELVFAQGALEESLAAMVSRLAGHHVKPDDFQKERLSDDLRMNIRIVDEQGDTVANGRELDDLRKRFGVKASETVASLNDPRWHREKLTDWNFGELPESIELTRGNIVLKAFPALKDCETSVSLQLADSPDRAARDTRLGLMRFFHLKNARDIRTHVQWIPNIEQWKVYAQPIPEFDIKKTLGELIAIRAMELDEKLIPRDEYDFSARMRIGKSQLGIAVQDVTRFSEPFFKSFQEARLAIERNKIAKNDSTWRDAKFALGELVSPGFMLRTPWAWLKEYPRYFKAVAARFEKLKSGGEVQDRTATAELAKYWNMYQERLDIHEASGISDPELLVFRYMIEEYRVSLFAQKLGTAVKVSANRLDKQWEKVRL